jgi:uncharacterized membrane protein YdbT with pleckstrin-like domain
MAFPKKLLIEGEEVVLDLRPHWFFFFGPMFGAALTVIAMFVLSGFTGGGIQAFFLWLGLAALVFFLAWAGWRYLSWINTNFVVTTARVVYRSGVFAKSGIQIPLERVNNVIFRQHLLERALGAGNLIIESAGETGRQEFQNVRHPDAVQNVINREMEANENRKYQKVGEAAAGGVANPTAAPAVTDVATQLEKLEGLLQRGSISQEEFDQQKKKLFGQA